MFGGFFGRAIKGAAAGGAIGGFSEGNLGGVIGGAAAGGLMGGVGGHYGRKMMGGRSGAGMAAAGLERAGMGLTAAASTVGHRGSFNMAMRARGGMSTAAGYLGNNAAWINKYGGKALGAAGVGSAAMMGSSMISSNRGY